MTVRQHVNIEKLEEFRSFLADNPDKGRLRLEAKAIYEGQAGRSLVHVGPFGLDDQEIDRPTRHYTFPFGAWREVEEATGLEGATDRMEPVEMALAATAACLINSITFNTARLGIDTSGLEITVRSTVDPRVLFAVKEPEEHKSCLGTIEYDVKVTGEVSDEDLETIHKLCRYSPVHGLMAETITISGKVTRA
ncbi:MAG: OsmC family protein [Alphaproteobacteria bacterium]